MFLGRMRQTLEQVVGGRRVMERLRDGLRQQVNQHESTLVTVYRALYEGDVREISPDEASVRAMEEVRMILGLESGQET